MRNLYLHIGVPKTGSSSIQYFLHKHREQLSERGILYPRAGMLHSGETAHNVLSYALQNKYPKMVPQHLRVTQEVAMEALLAEIGDSTCNTVVISSEAFIHCAKQSAVPVAWLKDCFRGFDVRVIVYFRRPDYWLESVYGQKVKSNVFTTKTADEFVETERITFIKPIQVYADIFTDKRMIVRSFDREKLLNGDVLDDFLSLIGLKTRDSEFRNVQKLNVSPGRDVTELFRNLNESVEMNARNRSILYRKLIEFFELNKIEQKKPIFNKVQRAKVMNKCKGEYGAFLSRFGLNG